MNNIKLFEDFINEGYFLNNYKVALRQVKSVLDKYGTNYKSIYDNDSCTFNFKYKGDNVYIYVNTQWDGNVSQKGQFLPTDSIIRVEFRYNKEGEEEHEVNVYNTEELEECLLNMVKDDTIRFIKKINESKDDDYFPSDISECVKYIEGFLDKLGLRYLTENFSYGSKFRFRTVIIDHDICIFGENYVDEDDGSLFMIVSISEDPSIVSIDLDEYYITKKSFEKGFQKWFGVDIDRIMKSINRS